MKHNRYIGKVCDKHPLLYGARYRSNRACTQCSQENSIATLKRISHVFEHYGKRCARCGEDDIDVLTIDHINQRGTEHRTESGRRYTGTHLYRWLRARGYPEGFRTLCHNCNHKVFKLYRRGESE